MDNKEVIVILGGGLFVDEKGQWHTDFGESGDMFGKTNSRWRVLAGKYLFDDASKQIIIASGGKGQYKNIPDAPTISAVIKDELIELGIPPQSIMEEEGSGNTLEQLKQVAKIISAHKPAKISIISNEWHLPRIDAFIKKDSALADAFKSTNVLLIPAEDVLIKGDPDKWAKIIEADKNSDAYKKREDLEKMGVRDIENGLYRGINYIKT